ncbi:hypothetical protein VPHD479_0265 [Vibrio phage D479]
MSRINKVMTGFNHVSRVGNLVLSTRSSDVRDDCERVVSLIECQGIESGFDVSHDGGGTLIVSEYISQLGTLAIQYQDVEIQTAVFHRAFKRSFKRNAASSEIDGFSLDDKYKLTPAPSFTLPEKVVLLAGSNLFSAIDWDYVDMVMEDEDVVIKPHPLTDVIRIHELEDKYGKDRIVSRLLSGIDIASNATHTWVCRSSEMWAVSTLCGVECNVIGMANDTGLYNTLIRAVDEIHEETRIDKKRILCTIIDSKWSGICRDYAEAEYKLPYTIEVIKDLGGEFNAPF